MSRAELLVACDALRRRYDPDSLAIQTTADLEPLEGITGQDRALAALRFGLGMGSAEGFNIYVAGPQGIGKMTAVEEFLQNASASEPVPPDVCYVNNFDDSYQPRALVLPTGKGRELRQDMRHLIEAVIEQIPRAFEDDEYQLAHREISKDLSDQRQELLEGLEHEAKACKHHIKLTAMGFLMVPVLGDQELGESELDDLPDQVKAEFEEKGKELQERIHDVIKQLRDVERAAKRSHEALNRSVAMYVIGQLIEELTERYDGHEQVKEYLGEVQESLLTWVEELRRSDDEPTVLMASAYDVNVLVDNTKTEGAPVVVERNPSYSNLVGRIEKESESGGVFSTDFRMVRGGSLHRANGGYLVLPVEALLRSPFSWEALKRALKAGEIQIEEPAEQLGLISTKSLRPIPFPLQVKVVLVGPSLLYYLLHRHDSEFSELFKVKSDFDTRTDSSDDSVQGFLRFLSRLCAKEGLLPLDATAAACLLEHSTRLAGDQDKLSMLFGRLGDVVREANYWAREVKATAVSVEHVERALEQQIYRSNLVEERLREFVTQGTVHIATAGVAVGQLNGLSVLRLGAFSFGRPCRITATVAVGQEGLVDIERKVELGGPLHSKGVMIIQGFLLGTYARERPLTLSARLAFEQSYDEVDGDSASSAELYALLSALAEAPIRQGIAVTGSIDQRGRVQAVGGINEKIEGFFRICRAQGLTGEQGVVIPASNRRHLHLHREVVEAVREGKFRVWAVESIDDGLEILTGSPGGARDVAGQFPPGSIHARVDEALAGFTGALLALEEEKQRLEQHKLTLPARFETEPPADQSPGL